MRNPDWGVTPELIPFTQKPREERRVLLMSWFLLPCQTQTLPCLPLFPCAKTVHVQTAGLLCNSDARICSVYKRLGRSLGLVLSSDDFTALALIAWFAFPSCRGEALGHGVPPSATEPGGVWVTQLVPPAGLMIEAR